MPVEDVHLVEGQQVDRALHLVDREEVAGHIEHEPPIGHAGSVDNAHLGDLDGPHRPAGAERPGRQQLTQRLHGIERPGGITRTDSDPLARHLKAIGPGTQRIADLEPDTAPFREVFGPDRRLPEARRQEFDERLAYGFHPRNSPFTGLSTGLLPGHPIGHPGRKPENALAFGHLHGARRHLHGAFRADHAAASRSQEGRSHKEHSAQKSTPRTEIPPAGTPSPRHSRRSVHPAIHDRPRLPEARCFRFSNSGSAPVRRSWHRGISPARRASLR